MFKTRYLSFFNGIKIDVWLETTYGYSGGLNIHIIKLDHQTSLRVSRSRNVKLCPL